MNWKWIFLIFLNNKNSISTKRSFIKARLHFPFTHAFTPLRCGFSLLTFVCWYLWIKKLLLRKCNAMWKTHAETGCGNSALIGQTFKENYVFFKNVFLKNHFHFNRFVLLPRKLIVLSCPNGFFEVRCLFRQVFVENWKILNFCYNKVFPAF